MYARTCLFLLILVWLTSALPHAFGAVKTEECLGCHDKYKTFLHGGTGCSDCHTDIAEVPHAEKLKKPSCQACHKDTQTAYAKSVHEKSGLACKDCHDVHQTKKEMKYCASCHADVAHKKLPAREKHLAELQCVACHSKVSASEVGIDVTIPPGTKVDKENFDRNGDGRLDAREWTFVEAYLEKNFKGHYRVTKRFSVKADVHAVREKSVSCDQCHLDRKVFGTARLQQVGPVTYQVPLDAKAFVPEIPSVQRYRETVHGRKGVVCSDCHYSREPVSDGVCTSCHEELYTLYKHTPHGTRNAARCTDCHNPHRVKSYKELDAQERVAVCARCHKDYISKHLWLPNTALHFHYLECATCHSPESKKSMIFQFGRKKPGGEESLLTYNDLVRLLPGSKDLRMAIDTNRDNVVSSQELADIFLGLKQKMGKELYIEGSILVTKVYHNFTVTRRHEKDCTVCHSKDAPFYDSMLLSLPTRDGKVFIPVKETVLSALPLSAAISMTLLGEEKIRPQDVRKLFTTGPQERAALARELGLRWIDFAGLSLAVLIVAFVLLHAILRRVTKR